MKAYLLFHKCASQWIQSVLGECRTGCSIAYMGSQEATPLPVDTIGMWENVDVSLPRYSMLADPRKTRAVTVIRDPRDILISAYYSHRDTHPIVEGWARLIAQRDRLRSTPVEEGMMLTLDFLQPLFTKLHSVLRSPAHIFHFEDIVRRPAWLVENILAVWDLGSTDIPCVVEKYSFANLQSGKVKTGGFPAEHYRCGQFGEWKEVLGVRIVTAFRERHGGLLEAYDASAHMSAER